MSRGFPSKVHPFSKGIYRNLIEFCCSCDDKQTLEAVPPVEDLEARAQPYTCIDIISCRCFDQGRSLKEAANRVTPRICTNLSISNLVAVLPTALKFTGQDHVPADGFEIMFFISLDRRRSEEEASPKGSLVRESDGSAYTTGEGTYRRERSKKKVRGGGGRQQWCTICCRVSCPPLAGLTQLIMLVRLFPSSPSPFSSFYSPERKSCRCRVPLGSRELSSCCGVRCKNKRVLEA
ncbi:hypothetical protein B296_00024066 [Ensete ventricosum]|uniref:Uncharacterized protein n=1 Tax=Ensete ventricosum TaxID=4639 RepID=A0A426Z1G1_ENSVE|nr:hypothetical protein B296_00024066 [Ensete ventricosum]